MKLRWKIVAVLAVVATLLGFGGATVAQAAPQRGPAVEVQAVAPQHLTADISTSGCNQGWNLGWAYVTGWAYCYAMVWGGYNQFRVRFVCNGAWVVYGPWRWIGDGERSTAGNLFCTTGSNRTIEKRIAA